ncbi:scavenger receptor cysteine-rich domain-containing protein DMBT1-like [Mytilus galloprovincialis]|uniref:scavenger receptor cysteine-rich domain-containing protein DMBT1-like n=1 Tax=Mytilus galloprovincialis TaxID=29158 RepID=UPI003F7C68D5
MNLLCGVECQLLGDLRILSTSPLNKGRLEIYYEGEWGTVCDNQFENVDAEVACRQLGYCSGIMIPSKLVYDGQGTIWLNDIDCLGSESKLLNCTHSVETSHCHHSEDVGVHCFLSCPAEDDEGLLRLMTCSADNKGRLEINYKGEWGTICQNYFDHVDAAVACRQLGYCSGQMIHSKYVDGGEGTIWLDYVNCFGSEHKLINCKHSIDTSHCSHLNDVGLHCYLNCPSEEDEGRLRLISSSCIANKGRLEISYKGEWGTICSSYFDHVDADVACRQLGYCSGQRITHQYVDDGQGTIWFTNMDCSGSENKLIDCTHSIDTLHCNHGFDVGLYCYLRCPLEEDEGLLRLISSSSANTGRLEINYKGEWGTICSTQFDDVDAAVACRQLGYCSGQMISHHYVEDGQGIIWFDNVNCSGSENKLIFCTHSIDTLHCSHWFDVGLYCYLSCPLEEDEGRLRLISSLTANTGRLEINYKGEWGTICSSQFDDVDAAVACRQLGYCSGQMISHHYVEDGQGIIWFDNVNCSGSENKLIYCTHSIDTLHCSHWFDVGLYCYLSCPLEEDEGRLRLISGLTANTGRLEINYKGEWGTICSNQFDDVDAAVACRQLGYCSGQMIRHHYVEDGQGIIWFDNVNCSGSENKLTNCTYSIDILHCSHWFDVGLYCYLSCPLEEDEGRLRLISSLTANKGRLEINYKGEWGTICHNHFDNVDAAVACRQLGYCSGQMIPYQNVEDGKGTIWLDAIHCSGSEHKLINCTYSTDTSHCSHWYDAGIDCFHNCSTDYEGMIVFYKKTLEAIVKKCLYIFFLFSLVLIFVI